MEDYCRPNSAIRRKQREKSLTTSTYSGDSTSLRIPTGSGRTAKAIVQRQNNRQPMPSTRGRRTRRRPPGWLGDGGRRSADGAGGITGPVGGARRRRSKPRPQNGRKRRRDVLSWPTARGQWAGSRQRAARCPLPRCPHAAPAPHRADGMHPRCTGRLPSRLPGPETGHGARPVHAHCNMRHATCTARPRTGHFLGGRRRAWRGPGAGLAQTSGARLTCWRCCCAGRPRHRLFFAGAARARAAAPGLESFWEGGRAVGPGPRTPHSAAPAPRNAKPPAPGGRSWCATWAQPPGPAHAACSAQVPAEARGCATAATLRRAAADTAAAVARARAPATASAPARRCPPLPGAPVSPISAAARIVSALPPRLSDARNRREQQAAASHSRRR
jgi:hypothetical protein